MALNEKKGLFVGRFQPVHKGHVKAIKYSLGKCGKLIIAVGSAQYARTADNPFSAKERIKMLKAALAESKIGKSKLGTKVTIVATTDVNSNSRWVGHMESCVPHFEIVFSNNLLVRKLFRKAGYKVESIPFYRREELEGKKIRKLMKAGDLRWKKLVPKAVSKLVEKKEKRVT